MHVFKGADNNSFDGYRFLSDCYLQVTWFVLHPGSSTVPCPAGFFPMKKRRKIPLISDNLFDQVTTSEAWCKATQWEKWHVCICVWACVCQMQDMLAHSQAQSELTHHSTSTLLGTWPPAAPATPLLSRSTQLPLHGLKRSWDHWHSDYTEVPTVVTR